MDTTPRFRDTVAFEWTKLVTARATCWTLIAVALLLPVFSVIVAATGSIQTDDTIFGGSLTGAVNAQLAGGIVGALVISIEHTRGMIGTTFTAVPRRSRVVAAKATVVAGLLFAATLLSSFVAFVIGLLMLDGDLYATGEPWPAMIGVAAGVAVAGLLGLALGAIVRHSAGAIAAVAAVLFVPLVVAPFFGDYRRWVGGASPMAMLQKLTQSSDASHEAAGSLGGWPSLGLVMLGTGIVLAVSTRVVNRRDA